GYPPPEHVNIRAQLSAVGGRGDKRKITRTVKGALADVECVNSSKRVFKVKPVEWVGVNVNREFGPCKAGITLGVSVRRHGILRIGYAVETIATGQLPQVDVVVDDVSEQRSFNGDVLRLEVQSEVHLKRLLGIKVGVPVFVLERAFVAAVRMQLRHRGCSETSRQVHFQRKSAAQHFRDAQACRIVREGG